MKNKHPLVGGLLNLLVPGLSNVYVRQWAGAVGQFFASVLGLLALLFVAVLLERTKPPWPEGLAPTAVLLLYFLGQFLKGMATVRRHNRGQPWAALPARAGAQPGRSGSHRASTGVHPAVVPLLTGITVVSCLLLVAVSWLAGLWDVEQWEPLIATRMPALAATRVPSTATPAPIAEATVPAGQSTPTVAATIPSAPAPGREVTPPPSAMPQATATPSEPQAVVNRETLNVRTGPGTDYPRVAVLRQGDQVTVTGRNKAATWLQVRLDDGQQGWLYADYTELSVTKASLEVVADIPAPPQTATPKATLTVDEQIARVARGRHGTLPQPGETGGVEAGGEAEVTILNDTPYVLTVLVGAPSSRSITIDACATCKVYSLIGPLSCQEQGRPRKTVRLQPGNSEVVARVSDSSVIPFYGRWELKANTGYFNCFYIVTKPQ
jgi:hypothetical protein